jgi:hypothetical protein
MAREANKPFRGYIQDVAGGSPSPLTPEGVNGYRLSPDDKYLAVTGGTQLFDMASKMIRPITGFTADDTLIDWSEDGQLFVLRQAGTRLTVYKLNPSTGARLEWTTLLGLAMAGVEGVASIDQRGR